MMKTIHDFEKMKKENQKISMVTCYDAWTAKIVDKSNIDCVLVGDSLAMVMHGFASTLNATVEMMALHTAAVVRGAPHKFVIADMPFLSFRKGLREAMDAVERLMQAGAHAVKIEGVHGHGEVIEHVVQSGVPVMAHIGLTPQSIHQLGGFKVQGRDHSIARDLVAQARELENLGCFAVVLECVPRDLAREITQALRVPTIGIGAGPEVDGQVLVLQDLIGGNAEFKPKFLKEYTQAFETLGSALNAYDKEVKELKFPTEKESYQ